MENIVDSLISGFEKYYNTVTKLGYTDLNAVNKLIVATWINEVLMGNYDMMVTEQQYKILENLYMCMEGSCFVPYSNYCRTATVNKRLSRNYIRATETNTSQFGSTERMLDNDDNLRLL